MRRYPFIGFFIPFATGICAQHFFSSNLRYDYISIILICILFILHISPVVNNYHNRWIWGINLYLLLFFTGCSLVQSQPKQSALPLESDIVFTGIVAKNPEARENTVRIQLGVSCYCDSVWNKCKETVFFYLKKDSGLVYPKVGDKLLLKTKLMPIASPQNPDEFDYKNYMARQGVFATTFANNHQLIVINENCLPIYRKIPLDIQRFVVGAFERAGIKEQELAVVTALTIGDKQYIDRDLKQSYASAGVVHLLAVSGLHVGIIYMAISFLLSFLHRLRFGKIIKGVLIILMLFIYAAIVGFSPSVTRATVMFSFFIAGNMFGKQRNTYNFLAASAFLICLYNPYNIFEIGFQLSYAAVLGIVFFQPKLNRLIFIKNTFLRRIWQAVCVTLAAQLATTPIVLYYFHQFPSYFLPANLLIIAFTTLIIYAAVLLLFLSWLLVLASGLGWILSKALTLLNNTVIWIESLPGSIVEGIYINVWQCCALLLSLVFFALFYVYRNSRIIMLFMICMIIVFGIRFRQALQNNKQQMFVVYDTGNSTFITYMKGNQGYCFRDSLNSANKFDFQTKNNLVKHGFSSAKELRTFTDLNFMPNVYHGFMALGDNILYFAGEDIDFLYHPVSAMEIDYLLISNQTVNDAHVLMSYLHPKKIIIDSSAPAWKARQWINAAVENNIPYYWVKQSGAFVINI